jgi:hypothetical protein
MEPLRTWERKGQIVWNPALGQFHDLHESRDIQGPLYFVTVRIKGANETVKIVRQQRALIPSLAQSRVRAHYDQHFPPDRLAVVLVKRASPLWRGWAALAREKAFPVPRNIA